jgi:hypothetical protein
MEAAGNIASNHPLRNANGMPYDLDKDGKEDKNDRDDKDDKAVLNSIIVTIVMVCIVILVVFVALSLTGFFST